MATKPASALPLIFLWRRPPTTLAVLGSFLVLSTLIHAMGFYVFHVVYQPAVSLPPSSSHVTIVDPTSAAAAPFLAWLNSEDPALTFLPDPVAPDLATLSPPYQSSIALFDVERLSPLGPLAQKNDEGAIARLVPQPITSPLPKHSRTVRGEGHSSSSVHANVRFDVLSPSAPLVFSVQEVNVAPAEFMLGIDRGGNVLYLFAERTTGSDAADKELARRLREIVFPVDESRPETAWERARVSWQSQPDGVK